MIKNKPATLKERVLKAGGWTLAGFGLSQIIRLGSNLLMTRLLAPEMFAVMAIALMVKSGLTMFSDVGLRQNIVHSKRGEDLAFLDTAWVCQIVRGILIFFLALAMSGIAAFAGENGYAPPESVYANSHLPSVIAAISIGAIIMGFESTKLLVASRNLALARVTQIELISQLAGLICMVSWAILDRSIWALVAGSLSSTLIKAVLSHSYVPGPNNRWQWDKKAFDEILHFGKWIFLSSILGFLVINGDRLMLGGFTSATILGVYVIAFFIAHSAEEAVTKIISQVSLPALSEVARQRPNDLKNTYYRFRLTLGSFVNFCAGFLMVSGQAIVNLLYDSRYADAGWILQILAVCLLAVPFRVSSQCFIALGAPKLMSHILIFRLTCLLVCLPLGFQWFGLPGAIWGITLSYLAEIPMTVYYKLQYRLFDGWKEMYVFPSVAAGVSIAMLFNLAVR